MGEFLDKMARQKIASESKAFEALHTDLITQYSGQYVAVHNGQVVDSDENARDLYLRMRERYGHVPVLVPVVHLKQLAATLVDDAWISSH